jgi:hypothetical protein
MRTIPPRRPKLAKVALSLLAVLTFMLAIPLFADERGGTSVAAAGVAFLVIGVIGIAFYVYFSLALQTIARKTNTQNEWWAWIPIISAVLMLNIARKPVWWIVLFLVPLINIVVIVLTFMGIAEARNKPSWWGILMIIPVVGMIVPGYLAWAD